MPYITRQTPSAYWNRHSDWYQGYFKSVADAIGQVGAVLFWMDCEGKAGFFHDLAMPLPLIGGALADFFVTVFRNHYNARYVETYDNWALQACKFLEKFQAEIDAIPKKIQDQVEQAKNYIDQNLIQPIRDKLNPIIQQINDAQSKIVSINNMLNGFQTQVNSLTQQADSFETRIRDLINRVSALEQKQTGGIAFPVKIPLLER